MTIHYHTNDIPKDALKPGLLALDTETMGLSLQRDRLCVVQLSDGNGDAHLVHFPDDDIEADNLTALLNHEDTNLICHYARFDLAQVLQNFGAIPTCFCTKIASKLLRTYSDRHGLKELCRELIGVEIDKGQQSSYWGNDALSEPQQKYAAQDVLYLHALKEKLETMAARENKAHMIETCQNFLPVRVMLDLDGYENMDVFSHS